MEMRQPEWTDFVLSGGVLSTTVVPEPGRGHRHRHRRGRKLDLVRWACPYDAPLRKIFNGQGLRKSAPVGIRSVHVGLRGDRPGCPRWSADIRCWLSGLALRSMSGLVLTAYWLMNVHSHAPTRDAVAWPFQGPEARDPRSALRMVSCSQEIVVAAASWNPKDSNDRSEFAGSPC